MVFGDEVGGGVTSLERYRREPEEDASHVNPSFKQRNQQQTDDHLPNSAREQET